MKVLNNSLFSSFADVFLSQTTNNWQVSSVKRLRFDDNPGNKSLIWTRKYKVQRIELWKNPIFSTAHSEVGPFNTWYLFQKIL